MMRAEIAIADITIDPSIQPRYEIDQDGECL